MGLVRGSAASSVVKAEPSLLWPIPPHWTMEDAATVPLPYAHAFYLLVSTILGLLLLLFDLTLKYHVSAIMIVYKLQNRLYHRRITQGLP